MLETVLRPEAIVRRGHVCGMSLAVRLWNGHVPTLTLGRATCNIIVVFVALQQSHLVYHGRLRE